MAEPVNERDFSATPFEVFTFIARSTRKRWAYFGLMFLIITVSQVFAVFVPIQTKRLIE